MSDTRFRRERRLLFIAGFVATILTLCITPLGIRAAGIYAYACLGCGSFGAEISDSIARFTHNVAQAPDWVGYIASYAAFLIANALLFFVLLWLVSTGFRLIFQAFSRNRGQLT